MPTPKSLDLDSHMMQVCYICRSWVKTS